MVHDGHVGNCVRFVSHDVVNFIFSVSIGASTRASPCPSPPCFLLKSCIRDLEIICLIMLLAGYPASLGRKGVRKGGEGGRQGGREGREGREGEGGRGGRDGKEGGREGRGGD